MEQRRKPCEDKARDWNEAATSQRKPGVTRSWKRQGKILSWSLSKGTWPCRCLEFGLLALRTVRE